jgi:hypothetical protein
LANRFDQPKSRDGHLALSPECNTNILTWIKKQAEESDAVTRTDIKDYCREVWKFEASDGWVGSFILRHSAELAEKKSRPQESHAGKFRESFWTKR